MNPNSGPRGPKATWYLLFAAFVWLEVLLVGMGSFMAHAYQASGRPAPGADSLRSLAYLITPLAVVASIYWARAKLASTVRPDPKVFTRDSVVALGIAEVGLMFSVIAFMRTDPTQILLFGAVTLVVDFAIILRAGWRYWEVDGRESRVESED